MINVYLALACVFVSFWLGAYGYARWKIRNSVGSIRVDTSDPEEAPYLFLELTKPMSTLFKSRYVYLKVDVRDYIPRK